MASFGPGNDTRRAQYIQQALDNGGHAIFEGIYNEWFKNGTPKNSDPDMNPDLEVFAALERLIQETHAAGLGAALSRLG